MAYHIMARDPEAREFKAYTMSAGHETEQQAMDSLRKKNAELKSIYPECEFFVEGDDRPWEQ